VALVHFLDVVCPMELLLKSLWAAKFLETMGYELRIICCKIRPAHALLVPHISLPLRSNYSSIHKYIIGQSMFLFTICLGLWKNLHAYFLFLY